MPLRRQASLVKTLTTRAIVPQGFPRVGPQSPRDGSSPRSSVVEGGDGALYGVTPGGGSEHVGVAYRLAPDSGYSILHHFGVTVEDGRNFGFSWFQYDDRV